MNNNKLQIRSKIMHIIQELKIHDEIPKEIVDSTLEKLYAVENRDNVLDILLKELISTDCSLNETIAYFLIELGNLDNLQEPLWSCLKDPNITDKPKELICVILRSLGDTTNPEEYFNYVENAQAIIDKETQNLLETAIVNPEAQIDFLDFFFSLPEKEQLNLVMSLQNDFSEQYIINIIVPALFITESKQVKETIINILGKTKSPFAVSPLLNIYNYDKDENLKKLAKKNLNLLKIGGVDLEKTEKMQRGKELCELTTPYKCYSNFYDGSGSKAIIVSRIKDNNDIIMCGIVTNDYEGIIDCFGFYGVSETDFNKIIEKFEHSSLRVEVPFEYCKSLLNNAEKLSIEKNNLIPYEYLAWKSIIYDFDEMTNNTQEILKNADDNNTSKATGLFNFEYFKHWFFEEYDSESIYNHLNNVLQNIINNEESFINNSKSLIKYLDEQVITIMEEAYIPTIRTLISNRLIDTSYLLKLQEINDLSNITASIAKEINPNSKVDIKDSMFAKNLMMRTIKEFLKTYQYKNESEQNNQVTNLWAKQINTENEEKKDISKILDIINDNWI